MKSGGSSPFPVTRWSLVGRAAARGTDNGRLALAELLQIYLPALRGHLVAAMRLDEHRADDLLQSFLADKVLQQNLISLVDRERGKFRSFLLTALERFAIDQFRRDSASSRSPGKKLVDVADYHESIYTPQHPAGIFDRIWAQEVLSEVMRRMRQECEVDRPHLWAIFESRILLPITDGMPAPSHDDLAARFKLESASHASNALGSAKRLFRRVFHSVVAEYARDESEIDSEIDELWKVFSTPAA